MDVEPAESQKKNIKKYYKNLAKRQKKRWRQRKKARWEYEGKRNNGGMNDEVEAMELGKELDAKYLKPTAVLEVEKETKSDEMRISLVSREKRESLTAGEKREKKHWSQPNACGHRFKEINIAGLVKIGKSVGAGTFGQCNLARYGGMIVVVKDYIVDNFSNKELLKQEVLHEGNVISALGDHQNLPLLYGICTVSLPYKMVLQFHGIGEKSLTIFKAVKSKQLTNDQWFDIVKGVAAGLNHVHVRGYLHNDLKANNVVIESSATGVYHNVLIDFGKSSRISSNYKRKNQLSYSASYPHIAPEIVDGSSGPSIKSDVFSFVRLLLFVEKHSSFDLFNERGSRVNSMVCSAGLLKNPKLRPTLKQIINYES